MNFPKVTCICNTRNRTDLLKKSIRYFRAQTYPNKQLLIVFEDDDVATANLASEYEDPIIKFLKVPAIPKLTLGGLRNLAVASADGELICVWDDDDWYHIRRLEVQISHLLASHKPACLMGYILIFDSSQNQAYMGHLRMWEGSLLCFKSLLLKDLKYGDLPKGEDHFLVDKLTRRNLVYPLIMPQLYIYVFHENNTWDKSHFDFMCSLSQKLSFQSSMIIKNILEGRFNVVESSNAMSSPEVLSELRYVM